MSWADSCDLEYALADLKADNERLQDEVERLRSCLSDSAENSKQVMHEAHVQEEENAKLRELVRDMYAVMVEDAANCDVTYPEQFDDRLRELGVEV